jgi:long-chain fatty acid transport protein
MNNFASGRARVGARRNAARVLGSLALIAASSAAVSLGCPGEASAAGLYFSDRGVRPTGRGGAFVAGADDLGAIWYNPAGVGFAGNAVLADASYLRFGSTFQRESVVKDPTAPGGERVVGSDYFPQVKGTSPLLPLPTLAISNNLGVADWNFALGVMAPYSALTTYPEEQLAFGGRNVPPPQRYSLITLDGSALAVVGAWAAYRPSDRVSIGAGLQALVGTFASRLAFSACPPTDLLCAGEDPQYDAISQLTVGPIIAPSGNIGVIGILQQTAESEVRVGAAFQLPFWINAPAKIDIRLPSAPLFANSTIEGNQANVKFRLPAIARLGIETRFGAKKQTRIEAAFTYEAWSMHDEIAISPSGSGIRMKNVGPLFETYEVGPISQQRGFRDTFSIHGGFEHGFEVGGYPMQFRGGLSYERSAVPPSYLSVLTVDLDKVQLALGHSMWVSAERKLRLDIVYAHTFAFSADVDPHAAAIEKVRVLRANAPPPEETVKINGGKYTAQADVIGVGLNWQY